MRRERQDLDAVASADNEPAGGVRLAPGVGRPGARESRGRYAQADRGRGCEPSGVEEQDPDRRLGTVAGHISPDRADERRRLDRKRRLADATGEREEANEAEATQEVRQDAGSSSGGVENR